MIPDDRKYSESHEWLRIEDDVAVVGITDHAQRRLGDITFVEFPEPGQRFEAGEVCMTVESVKAASDIYLPVAGTVREINRTLEDHPEIVNQDPHGAGWLVKIEDYDAAAVESLLDAEGYAARVRDEE